MQEPPPVTMSRSTVRGAEWYGPAVGGHRAMLKGSDVYSSDSVPDRSIALAELYETQFERVWRWLHGMGVREADLEDAAQEVFFVAHRRYEEFEGRSSVTTWLYGISLRVAAAFRRKAHVRREVATEDMSAVITEEGSRPDDTFTGKQAAEIAQRILDGLDDDKRAAFVLYEIEQCTLREIAELMNCPLQTVYTRLNAARAHFRAEVARLNSNGGNRHG